MPYVDFAELKAHTSIEQVLPMLDIDFKQSGDQWRGQCPVCNGKSRNLVVTKSRQAWHCFGCRKGGDMIALVATIHELAVKDAAVAITDFLGTGTSTSNRTSSRVTVPHSERGEGQGTRTLQPLTYLETSHDAVERLGLSPETLEHFEAGYAPKGILRGRLAIPIHDLGGELVAYCGRAVKNGQTPVLIFPKGFDPSRYVFNLHRMEEGELYCSLDPLDVLLAFQNGVENAIAFLHRAAETNVVRLPARSA